MAEKMAEKAQVVEEKNGGAGLIAFGISAIILSAVGIGMTVPYLLAPGVGDFSALLGAVGSGYASDFSMPFIMIAGGAIGLIGGAVGIVGGVLKSRIIGVIAILMVITGGGITVGSAAYLQLVLDTTFERLQLDPRETDFTPQEQSLLDVTSAIYNECCFKVYDPICGTLYNEGADCSAPDYDQGTTRLTLDPGVRDNETPVLQCDNPDICTGYPPIIDTAETLISNIKELLCVCYSSDDAYNKIVESVKSLGMCKKLESMVVRNAGEIGIPTTSQTFGDLPNGVRVGRPELGGLELDEMAVVGKIYPPEPILGTEAAEIGWSCGLGYSKSVAFTIYLAIDAAASLPLTFAYVAGGGNLAISIFLALYWCMGGGQDDGLYYEEQNEVAYGQY